MLSTVEKVFSLKQVTLFEHIPGEALARIARITHEEEFAPGEVLMAEKDIGDSLYLILEGQVRVHAGATHLANLGQNECVGEMAILDAEQRSATVTAMDDVLTLKIEREDFYEILMERNEVALGIIRVLTQRLRAESEKYRTLKARIT